MNVFSIKKGSQVIQRRVQKLEDGTMYIKYNKEHYKLAYYEPTGRETYKERFVKFVCLGKIEVLPKQESPEPLVFVYTNWKGETAIRKVVHQEFFVGCTKYHPNTQVLMKAFDLDKNEIRTFAVNDISKILNLSEEDNSEKK